MTNLGTSRVCLTFTRPTDHDGQEYLVKKGDNGSAHRTDSCWNPSVRHGLHVHG